MVPRSSNGDGENQQQDHDQAHGFEPGRWRSARGSSSPEMIDPPHANIVDEPTMHSSGQAGRLSHMDA
jgi:hypothetical protein